MTPKISVMALAGFVLAAGPAWAEGDAETGRRSALDWCSECHLVTADQAAPVSDAAPTFQAMAARIDRKGYLETFLQDPHPPMTGIHISRQDIEDLAAYIRSLRRN